IEAEGVIWQTQPSRHIVDWILRGNLHSLRQSRVEIKRFGFVIGNDQIVRRGMLPEKFNAVSSGADICLLQIADKENVFSRKESIHRPDWNVQRKGLVLRIGDFLGPKRPGRELRKFSANKHKHQGNERVILSATCSENQNGGGDREEREYGGGIANAGHPQGRCSLGRRHYRGISEHACEDCSEPASFGRFQRSPGRGDQCDNNQSDDSNQGSYRRSLDAVLRQTNEVLAY